MNLIKTMIKQKPKLIFFCLLFMLATIYCYLICKSIDSTIYDYGLIRLIRKIFVLIFLTFSNLCYVYIAWTSLFVERKIKFLSSLHKTIDMIKKNIFVFFFIFVLLICLINCIRQPIFFIIGWNNVSYNLFSYIICMTSTVVPVVYTLCGLEKRIKTGVWDFSFRVENLNRIINYYSVFIYIFFLIICYCFIKPLIPLIIYNFAICRPILISALFENIKMISTKIKPVMLTVPIFLPHLTVENLFRWFRSDIFSNLDVRNSVDSPNQVIKAENTPERSCVRFSVEGWLSKNHYSSYVKNNMVSCANNIPYPYIPHDAFYSYWDVPEIANQLNNGNKDEISFKQITLNIVSFYFNPHSKLFTVHGGPSSQAWYTSTQLRDRIPPMDVQTIYNGRKHCALVGRNNKSWSYILQELPRYTDFKIAGYMEGSTPYLIFYKDQYIAFAEFKRAYHGQNTLKTPTGLNQRATDEAADYAGILGLVATTKGVEVIPQKNIYSPQLAFYDITNKKHAFAIHMQFKYLDLNKELVQRDAQHLSQVNIFDPTQHITAHLTEPVIGRNTYDVGLKLNTSGQLIRR